MYDEDLMNLDDGIRRLKVEYDIFFNGHRKKPPDDLRMRVEKIVKKLAECGNMTYGERFRYNTLIGRYYVYRDRWRRRMADKELDATPRSEAPKQKIPAKKSPPPSLDPVSVSITDPAQDEEKVRFLYESLLKVRERNRKAAPILPYEQFSKYISNQTEGIKEKHHCSNVKFTLIFEEGSLRFTARAGDKA